MFWRKVDEIFKNLPNVFGIADDILAVGYDCDGKDHDNTLWKQAGKHKIKQRRMSLQVHIHPILAYADFLEPFKLHTDACALGLGAILYQN